MLEPRSAFTGTDKVRPPDLFSDSIGHKPPRCASAVASVAHKSDNRAIHCILFGFKSHIIPRRRAQRYRVGLQRIGADYTVEASRSVQK